MTIKKFGTNAIIYSLGIVALRATAFLLIPIYSHYLTITEFGILAALQITIQFFVEIIDLGLRSGLNRFISQYERSGKTGQLLGSYILLNLLSGIVVTLLTFQFFQPLLLQVLHQQEILNYMLLLCAASISQSLCINLVSYFRAVNNGKFFVIYNLIAAVLFIAGNAICLMVFSWGLEGVLVVSIAVYLVIFIFVLQKISTQIRLSISLRALKELLKYCFPLLFATVGWSLINTISVYILSIFCSLENVAVYNLAYKLSQISTMVILLPFQLAYEPYLFSHIDDPQIKQNIARIFTYLLFAFSITAYLIVFIFRDLINIIAPVQYHDAYLYTFMFLPGVAFYGLQYIGQSLIHIRNKTYITGAVFSIFSVVNFVLNYFLIQRWSVNGTIIVHNLTSAGIAIVLFIIGNRSYPVSLETRRVLITSGIFVVLLSSVFLLQHSNSIIFYLSQPILLSAVFLMLILIKFFDANEILLLKRTIFSIKKIILKRKYQYTNADF